MNLSSLLDSGDSRQSGLTRRDYLRTAGAAGVGGLGLATLGEVGVAAAASHTVTIRGTGSRARYTLSTTDGLQKSTTNGGTINQNDHITKSTVSGVVVAIADSYTFSGKIESFSLDGDAEVLLDEQRLDPREYPDHVLTIEGTDSRTNYTFSTSGKLEKSTANGASISHEDHLTGTTASGAVGSGADSYVFSGKLESFSLDGPAIVSLDGEPAHVGQRPDHVLTITGTGPRAAYTFSTSGDLAKSTANGAGISGEDHITESTASGAVGNGVDSYVFSGKLESFSLDGSAAVSLDGKPAHVGQRPDHVLTITGTGPRAAYTFSTSGYLAKSTANGAGISGEDGIIGSTASGAVGNGADSYTFSGKLVDFELHGDADVSLDGERLAPESFGYDWEEDTSLPAVQSDAGGGVLDGELYVYGGIETGTDLEAVARGFAYDPSKGSGGSWRRIDDLPRRLWGNCGIATDDALYSFGGAPPDSPYSGEPPTDVVFKYTPRTGWRNLTARRGVRCPYPNWVMKGLYNPVDGLIYCVGGGTGNHDAPTATDHGLGGDKPGAYDERRIWSYDPDAERVANPDLARMPEAKRWTTVALVEVDGRQYIHALGGLLGTGGPTDSNFRYDIEANRFEAARSLPMQGTYGIHENPVIGNKVYLTHGMFWRGRSTIDRYKRVAHRYDPVTDTFDTDLPNPRHRRGGAIGGVIDGTLHVVGGHLKRPERNHLHDCTAYNEGFSFST